LVEPHKPFHHKKKKKKKKHFNHLCSEIAGGYQVEELSKGSGRATVIEESGSLV